MKTTVNERIDFFNSIADKWDSWESIDLLEKKLDEAFIEFGIKEGEFVLDVGCGTGNLTRVFLRRFSKGRIAAIDISEQMLEVAKRKIFDSRVIWNLASVESLPFDDNTFDRIICFSVWPHISDPVKAVSEMYRVLRPSGHVHVWHIISKEEVNRIHKEALKAVVNDILLPAAVTANYFAENGFQLETIIDNNLRYLVSAVKQS